MPNMVSDVIASGGLFSFTTVETFGVWKDHSLELLKGKSNKNKLNLYE